MGVGNKKKMLIDTQRRNKEGRKKEINKFNLCYEAKGYASLAMGKPVLTTQH